MNIRETLSESADKSYAAFQSKLTPNIDAELFIGVRVPDLRKIAKQLYKNDEYKEFLSELPHKYYDENMLHGLIISEIRDFDSCTAAVEEFLPYVDNWAVCDTMSPKCFKKRKKELLPMIEKWMASSAEYTQRFGLEMLMSHFLDEDFNPDLLEKAASVRSDRYYVNMMTAWFFATALAKQWESTIVFIEQNRLDTWVHNKTIQKARESFRITPEQKDHLNSLRR